MKATEAELMDVLKTRRSVREFLEKNIEAEKITKILEAGRWAPSGLNNQPWRFMVIDNSNDGKIKNKLATQTHYRNIINSAPVCIAVFLDQKEGYDRTKDLQAIGACIQNMLLYIHRMGLGGCWLGEILKNKDNVANILGIPDNYELMAVIAIGYPAQKEGQSTRKKLGELLYEKPES